MFINLLYNNAIVWDILLSSLAFSLQGLAEDLSKEGACEKAIFPDTNIVVTRCAMIGNLSVEGVSNFQSYFEQSFQ
jgi:hypothetical protein